MLKDADDTGKPLLDHAKFKGKVLILLLKLGFQYVYIVVPRKKNKITIFLIFF